MSTPLLISTAIPYANGSPHIGHAYERIATDMFARHARLSGREVKFITGMDEHGQKVLKSAAHLGVSPQTYVDQVATEFVELGSLLNAVTDDVVRTTQERNKLASQEIWRRMEARGDIYLSKYSGWYSVRDEAYFDEIELTTMPDGKKLAPSGAPVEHVDEESYFFKLSAYQQKLLDYYAKHPDFVVPEKYFNEIKAFVAAGLTDLSISRTTFDWGVPVPNDPKHVMYVWVDALTNYITSTGFPDESHPDYRFWQGGPHHIVGKDITRFHAIYWPAFLMSADLPLPKHIVVHGHLFNRGEKMSKSVGNVISPMALVANYGIDAMRYFFLREVPFGSDGSYSHEAIVQRTNADLANDLGNLAQRSLSMIQKNVEGKVPAPSTGEAADQALLQKGYELAVLAPQQMGQFAPHLALQSIWAYIAEVNRYFAGLEPWRLGKTDPARRDGVLYATIEALRIIAILAQPAIPEAAGKLLDLLAVPLDQRDYAHANGAFALHPARPLPAPSALFPRYVEEEVAS